MGIWAEEMWKEFFVFELSYRLIKEITKAISQAVSGEGESMKEDARSVRR